ncbi:DUF1631 family protein [Comamonas flocculans]|uniref:DUF1631 domain-containing protein n=1 Tax=Comamonas flocculans TaxID=2597701 RepID=A0A5B8RSR3_9BURK|nr:DUF1631 family protein [Comamonas flocculans]QEA12531.1 DUF1631 domain-containing protein [Comamonas flocculans]
MASTPMYRPSSDLAGAARRHFVQSLCDSLPGVDKALFDALNELVGEVATHQVMQRRRDTWLHYRSHHQKWADGVAQAWRDAEGGAQRKSAPHGLSGGGLDGLQLVSEDAVENRLLGARLARAIAAKADSTLEAVRQRTKYLEGRELEADDVLRPEVACLALVDQWFDAGLSRDELDLVFDSLETALTKAAVPAYEAVVELYDKQGVPDLAALRSRVVRPPSATSRAHAGAAAAFAASQAATSGYGALASGSQLGSAGAHLAPPPGMVAPSAYGSFPGSAQAVDAAQAYGWSQLDMTRQRAEEVMVQLQHLLIQSSTGFSPVHAPPATMALSQALGSMQVQANAFYGGAGPHMLVSAYTPVAVAQAVTEVRQRAVELKEKAETASEKAIIEIVALMFQSILDEDRIPPSVRVWFARLQVPVLRVALAEPEFFNQVDHPARKLIDRMGSCVLGFDANAINGSALEKEIRRVVQVIEQYPETGSKVFQIVHDEFEKFLADSLVKAQKTSSEIVGVAQQMEQKETLTVQFTIELRTMLRDMPVREEIRDFLFRTWAEVLAMAAVKYGVQDKETTQYKRVAADLVWASGAKPNRSERNQVIQMLPGILERLRRGLALVGMEGEAQDAQIKELTDTLAEAFVAKTAVIAQERIDEMAQRLVDLEDFISDESLGDIPLNAENIELLLGIDASAIDVIPDTDAPVQSEALKRANELPLGTWYTLDHNGGTMRVQYVWHSQRKQLHLFIAPSGQNYLFQARRLAAYLQARLLTPQDVEGITVRATRNVVAKLNANPERLLS